MKILVIAPHMDGEVLCCAVPSSGMSGDQVSVCIVTNRAYVHCCAPGLIDREKQACRRA